MASWRLPIAPAHHLSASAGALSFVGGSGDFDEAGAIRHPGDLARQIPGAIENLEAALATESCTLADVVRLKAYYRSDGSVDEWEVLGALAAPFDRAPAPAISLLPVPQQAFAGQAIQIQAIAQRGWRSLSDVRSVAQSVPDAERHRFPISPTSGLRAGELIALASRTAESPDGIIEGDGPAQTRAVMTSMARTLAELGASFQDAVKKEGYYFGTSRPEWAAMASVRASYFREPGPVATVVPCQMLFPAAALTKIEVLALRARRSTFDKYIPREDSWPARVWDWPIALPYRQAMRLRDVIWLGGQVPSEPFNNSGVRMHPGDLAKQTAFTVSYLEDLLRGFGRRAADLKLAVCYFRSDGRPESTEAFVRTLAECVGGALPPLTLVPQPQMHEPANTVEIWGVAQG